MQHKDTQEGERAEQNAEPGRHPALADPEGAGGKAKQGCTAQGPWQAG